MKNINAFAVGIHVAGAVRALPASTWTAHAASAAARKRRTATAGLVDGGSI
jgi:hypothetical protein